VARDQLQRLSEPMYYLLLTLLEENHGYAMMHDIEMISKGRVKVGTGTLYTLLARFEKEGIIRATRSLERKKYYIITEKGKELLKEEYEALKNQLDDGKEIESI
jgi:transcriptional regulator